MNDNNIFLGAEYEQINVVEVRSRKWIVMDTEGGLDFNSYLIYLYYNSSIHNAIVNGMASMVYGEGLEWTGNPGDVAKAERLFKDSDIRKICHDFKLFNKYAFQVVWNLAGTQVATVKHIPVQSVRIASDSDGYWYSDRWTDSRQAKYRPKYFPKFGEEDKNETQILFYQPYITGNMYYSLPDYQGSLNWINLDIEIGKFHNANIINGLNPGMLLNFNNGEPNEQQRKEVERKVQNKWGGSTNAGKTIIAFNKTKDQAATVDVVGSSDLDKQFQFLSENVPLWISSGHGAPPILFGVQTESGFSSNATELESSFAYLNQTKFANYQRQILDGIEVLAIAAGLGNLTVEFIPFVPDFGQTETETETTTETQTETNLSANMPTDDDVLKMFDGVDDDEEDLSNYTLVETVNMETGESTFYELQSEAEKKTVATDKAALASGISGTDARKKSRLDTDEYVLRFQYGGPSPIKTSRTFCREMKTKYKKKVFRIEDINQLSEKESNRSFGMYSIFEWKGSFNCRHHWIAELHKRKDYTGPLPKTTAIMQDDPQMAQQLPQALRTNPKVQ